MPVGNNNNNDVKHCLHVWRWGTHFYKVLWRHNCHIIFAACQKEDYAGPGVCIDSEHYEKLSWRETLMRGPRTAGPRPRPLPLVSLFSARLLTFCPHTIRWWLVVPNITLGEIKCKESQKYHNWRVAGAWWRLHYQLMLRPRRKHNNWQ